MGQMRPILRAEIARVHRELIAFRDRYLPAFFEPWAPDPSIIPPGARERLDQIAHPLRRWRDASNRLLEALPITPPGEADPPLDRAEYGEFLFQPASASSHVIREGRIVWRIELFVGWDWATEDILSRMRGGEVAIPDPVEELRRVLPEAERWLMSLPVDESLLWNLLCMALPPISDLDPGFAKLALDPETWRTIVLSDREIGEETRSRRLAAVDGDLRRVLNNALLHVLAALANNHFEVIADLLDHPDLIGTYTGLMPHYLFAVLFEKVEALRTLAREDVDLDTGAAMSFRGETQTGL
jgi:hypothetical protein